MMPPDSAFRWLSTRVDSAARGRALDAFNETLRRIDSGASGIVVAHADNAAYAGAWLAAATRGVPAWCANPKWSDAERTEASALIPPDAVWVGAEEAQSNAQGGFLTARSSATNSAFRILHSALFIPTGGTGGRIRFVRHTPATLAAAVSGFSTYAGERLLRSGRPAKIHAVQALPCCHVSGLMPVVRAWLTDAEIVFTSPSFRPDEALPEMPATADGLTVVSLVAAQLHRLLERADGPAWLREAGLALVGGSSIPTELLARARAEKIPLGVSYGLTEAAALVALHPPDAFLRGDTPVAGEILPHIQVSITPEGRVALDGASLGEDVSRNAEGRYITGDEGFLDASGRLVVTGRADRIIVSGGEKIDPAEIEVAIRATGLVREVVVLGEPDPEWGRRLVAVYEGDFAAGAIVDALVSRLSRHRLPKRWVRATGPLFDEKGKLHRGLADGRDSMSV